jgi:hypothetical protein
MSSRTLCARLRLSRSVSLLSLAAVTGLVSVNAQTPWESSKVRIVDGRLTYPADSEGNRIVDFSNAGYAGGDRAIPNVTRVVGSVTPSMAVAQINAAISQAGNLTSASNPGVVTFAAGTYNVGSTIIVDKPGIILRGAGASTIIKATAGGVILRVDGKTPSRYDWDEVATGTRVRITTPKVQVGSRTFQVANASLFKQGDEIIVDHPQTDAWVRAVDTGDNQGNRYWLPGSGAPGSIRYHRYVAKVEADTITLDAPVFNHLDSQYFDSTKPIDQQRSIYRSARNITVREVGVENLTVQGLSGQTRDAIIFRGVENCWIRGVTVSAFTRSGIYFTDGATRSTARECRVIDPSGGEDTGNWYHFFVERAQLILFDRCFARKARHAFISNGGTYDSGIVVLRSTVDDARGSSEMHRYWGQAMLFDACKAVNTASGEDVIQFYNRGHAGNPNISTVDDPGHGWSSVHSVIWGFDGGGTGRHFVQKPRTAQNYAIGVLNSPIRPSTVNPGSLGFIEGTGRAGLTPESLYEAQRNERLGGTTPPPAPSFTFSASPDSRTITQGISTTYTATVTAQNGFNAAVSLSVSGLPTGATASFSPTSITGGGSSTLTVSTTTSTPAGNYNVTINAVSGSITRSDTVALSITAVSAPDFGLTSTPTSRSVAQGGSGAFSITVGAQNGFTSLVSLTASGLPAGATATFAPTSVAGSGSSTLTVNVGASTAVGTYPLTVTGTAGALTRTLGLSLTVTSSNPDPVATPITLPFVKDGAGDFTWVFTDSTIKLFNSWNLTKLEINGVDYTNKWSSTLPPPAADGKYYIRYIGEFAWSHFEILKP